MEAILDQVKHFTKTADEAARQKLIVGLRDLAYAIESPDDTMQRIMFANLQISIIRVGIGLKIFDLLAASQSPLTLEHLTQATGADSALLGRVLRYLSSMGIIKEAGKDLFAAINITTTLASPGNQAGVYHYFETAGVVYQELPGYLAQHRYQNVMDNKKSALQEAWKTELPVFLWLPTREEAYAQFNLHMAARRDAATMPTWLSVYPIQQETKGWNPEAPVFVDIGGGIGHQCAGLKAKYPELPGRVILQDLPNCLKDALTTPGVENMVHDITHPEPIKGAKYYYMRCVLHDFSDDKCKLMLRNVVSAMNEDSVLLIDEMVLPDTDVPWQATQIDLSMMAFFGSAERTRSQWHDMLQSVGLVIANIYVYSASHESVMAAVLKAN